MVTSPSSRADSAASREGEEEVMQTSSNALAGRLRPSTTPSQWPESPALRELTLSHAGRGYETRIYPRGDAFIAMAMVCDKVVDGGIGETQLHALARLIKRLDPNAGTIRNKAGAVLAE